MLHIIVVINVCRKLHWVEQIFLGRRGQRWPKLAKTVQNNLDGQKWSKNLLSEFCSQNSANLFWDTMFTTIHYYS